MLPEARIVWRGSGLSALNGPLDREQRDYSDADRHHEAENEEAGAHLMWFTVAAMGSPLLVTTALPMKPRRNCEIDGR